MFQLLRYSKLVTSNLCLRGATLWAASLSSHQKCLRLVHGGSLRRCLGTGKAPSSENSEPRKEPLVVYEGPLAGQMKRLKVFSLFTSGIGVYAAPVVMQEMSKAGMGIAIMMGSVMGVFTLLTPLLIHLVVRNYVVRMEYDETTDTYTATTISLMLRKRTVTFGVDDVLVPAVPGMFTTFVVRGRSLFVDAAQFSPLEHYGRLMGFDRPVDLKLGKPPPRPPAPPKT